MDDFGGLWHLDVVDRKLSKLSSENEKRLALKIQLTFWQKVIGVKCAKTYFTMSSSGVMKPISKLLENLKHVITWNLDTPDSDVDFSKPYIISATELNFIFNKNAENNSASQQQNEAEKVGQKRSKANGSGSRGKKKAKVVIVDDRRDENKVPVVSNGHELVGKVVDHFCYLDEEDKQGWHRGVVLAMSGKDRFRVSYNDFPDVIYSRKIYKDFKLGYVSLKPKDLIGASIRHMYTDGESNENIWWNAEVADEDPDTSDANGPDFFVIYDESGEAEEGQQEKQEYYLTPLLGDYLNHWVQAVSLDLDGEHGPEQ